MDEVKREVNAIVDNHASAFPISLVVREYQSSIGQDAFLIRPTSRTPLRLKNLSTRILECRYKYAPALQLELGLRLARGRSYAWEPVACPRTSCCNNCEIGLRVNSCHCRNQVVLLRWIRPVDAESIDP